MISMRIEAYVSRLECELRQRGVVDSRIVDEVREHLVDAVDASVRRGLSAEAAEREALGRFGPPETIAAAFLSTRHPMPKRVGVLLSSLRRVLREHPAHPRQYHASSRLLRLLESTLQDFRVGSRVLWQAPSFSGTIALLIALIVGTNSSAFSILHGLISKPAPGVNAAGLVMLDAARAGGMPTPEDSYSNYLDYAAQARTVQPLAAFGFERMTLGLKDGTYAVAATLVSENYFDVLGVRLARGRHFDAAANEARPLQAIVSYRVWEQQFNGDEDVIGRPVVLNGHDAEIVGVAPPPFRGVTFTEYTDVWVPFPSYAVASDAPELITNRSDARVIAIGRLAAGATVRRAQAEFQTISRRLEQAYPKTNKGLSIAVAPYTLGALGPVARLAPVLFAVLTVLSVVALVIVCMNVTNLMLARAAARQRDVAIRQSLGASRARIFRQQLAESIVISLAGALGAALFAMWLPQTVIGLLPPNRAGVRVAPDLTADAQVLVSTAVLSLIAAFAFTALPALRTRRVELVESLRASAPTMAPGRLRMSRALVVIQIALAVVLLTSAGLAYRSLALAETVDLRFDKRNLLLVSVRTAASAQMPERNQLLIGRLLERVRTIPGVAAVSFSSPPGSAFATQMRTSSADDPMMVDSKMVGPDYLRVLGLAPLEGRGIGEDQDRPSGPRVAAISANLAAALWPHGSPIGQRLLVGESREPVEIVGVVPDGILGTFRGQTRSRFVLFAASQNRALPFETTFYIRHTARLDQIAPAVRAAFKDVDPQTAVVYMRTMETDLQTLTASMRLVDVVLSVFAVVCVLVAVIGLYAIVAYTVRSRSRDFGVRLALGATPVDIVQLVLSEGVLMAGIGLVAGLALSAAAGQVFRTLLVGVSPTDPATFATVFAIVGGLALLASYVPASRVARADPAHILRQE
jgi:putative ABC transport system permease protein